MKAKGILHHSNYGLELIFKFFSIRYIYFNRVGLKVINSKLKQIDIEHYINKRIDISPSQQLFLLPDFLYDEYTLVNNEIRKTPHYSFMSSLLRGEEILDSEYIQRSKKGTIDMRLCVNYKKEFYRTLFEKRIDQINNNKIKPVLLTKINNFYYILDGKHRASLLFLLNKTCPCIVLDNFDLKEYFKCFWKKIRVRHSGRHEKHLSFYNQL